MNGALVTRTPVLDHGFVLLRNISGPTRRIYEDHDSKYFREFDADDIDPANAARMSFDQMDSGRTREEDLKLADYLLRSGHTGPFEQIQVWLEMKMPIFVARQFVRHRTTRLNEVSGRYVTLPAEWYIPEVVGGKAKNAKQGQADNLTPIQQEQFKFALDRHANRGYVAYTGAIADGVAPEHARMFLSLNHYTHWIWNQDLHNLMHFLRLRAHSHAQIEAQKYAKAIIDLIRMRLPHSMALFDKYMTLPG